MGPRCLLSCCFLLTALLCSSNAGVMKQLLRHRRPTLPPLKEQNITLPGTDRPLVFNHVYNINVPASSLCSVDLDAPGSSELPPKDSPMSSGYQSAEHTINGENQIVFTHRINVPRKACGCAEDLPGLKDLLRRLQVLEGEVSALKRQCSGVGCCSETVSGDVGTKPFCNGHGNFSAETCDCVCDPGWTGSNCTEPLCPNNCQGRGRCLGGKCECHEGFTGEDCSQDGCAADCRPSGRCVGGVCVCSDGFFGDDCSQTKCLNNCQGRGRCSAGSCVCAEPWSGVDCSDLACLKDCHARGRCVNGTCHCEAGFTGEDCGERTCPNNCQGNGFCIEGRCACIAGFGGEDCSRLTCLRDCNGRGACFNGMCICDHGYQGEDCSQLACLNNCNSRGQCINGQCSCDVGFHGSDCSELSCPHDCRLRGQCVNGQCVCEEGFAGEDCSIRTCPSSCHGRGDCVEGRCQCHAGFSGQDCSRLSCPNSCLSRGRCMDGQCVCDEGFAGEDCGQKACLNDCLARGHCVEGTCVCQEGFTGDDCSVLACPDSCNNRGRCIKGRCTCQPGYQGESCAELSCLNDCQGRGQCVNGGCLCDEGYIGGDCSEVSPPTDLLVDQVTAVSADLRWKNQMLVSEYLVTFVPTSNDGLLKKFTVRGDQTSTTVKALEPGVEYQVNVYAVLNKAESAPISARFTTALPQPGGLRFKSISDTSVEVLWDPLDFPFDRWEIIFRNTKEENGAVLQRLPSSQNQFVQSGLGPGQEYEVSVNMVKNQTRGPLTSHRVTTRIDAPRQVEVKHVTDSSALVSWSQSLAPLDKVSVAYSPGSDPAAEVRVDVFPPDKQLNIAGLKPDTQYNVTLKAERGNINSRSVHTSFTTDLDAPQHLQTPAQSDTSITLVWTNSRADISGYRVKYSPISGAAHGEEVFPQGPGDVTEAAITGLRPGTEYGIGVTAVKDERESLPATTNAATELDPPRDFQKEESSETTLTLSWKRPEAKVTGYRLVYVSSDGQVDEVVIPAVETSHMLSDLAPGTGYTLSLTAERAHKRSRTVTLQAFTTPDRYRAVANLTLSDISWGGFTASWTPVGGELDSFVLEVTNLDDYRESQNLTLSGGASSLEISGLNPNTTYLVGLYGMLDGSFLEPQYSEATTVNQPMIGNFDVSNVTLESFSISWSVTEGELDAFVLEVIDSDWLMEPKEFHLPRNVRSHEVTGLRPGTDYIAYLYGTFMGSRTSPLSVVASTAEEPALSRLVVHNVTSDRFSLSWRAAEETFDNFLVEVRESARPSQAMGRALPGDVRSTVMAGLRASTSYDIKLYASAGGRNSPPLYAVATTGTEANAAALIFAAGPLTEQLSSLIHAEQVPQLGPLAAAPASPHNLSLSWSTLSGHFDGFVVRVSDSEQQSDPLEFRLPGGVCNITIANLMDATGYDVELYGISHGRQTPSVLTHAVTEAEPEVEQLFVSDISSDGFRVSWAAEEDIFDRFVIKIRDSKRLRHPQEFNVHGDERTKVLTGLMGGTEYEIELYGVTLDQRSQPVTGVAQTALTTPKGLHFSDVTDSSAVVHWSVPRSPVDSYRITYLPFEGGSPMTVTVDGDVLEALLPNMMPGKMYQVTVSALKGLEESEPSSDTVTTALDRPQAVAVTNVTDFSALLTWQPSVAAVDGYVISYSANSVSPVVEHVSGNTWQFLMSTLVPGTRYTVEVYAVKEAQKSDSAAAEFTTDVDPPRDLMAVNIQADAATLTWKPPQAAVTGYTLSFSAKGESVREVVLSPTASSYNMAQLSGGTQYSVRLQTIVGAERSRHVTAVFTTVGQMHQFPKDCAQVLVNGETASGVYTVYVAGEESQPLQVYCDMSTDGGGWLVFLRRQNGKLEFFRNWKNYTAGFGNMNDEFWLGLSNLHKITASDHYELRVDLRDHGDSAYAQYDKFTIAEPRTRYKLSIGSYSGTAGDSMFYHQGRPFSTYDNDNDIAVTNCALSYKGAFWYKNCHRVNLMGKYGDTNHSKGINWFHWKGHETSIQFAEMKLRPADFKNLEIRKKRS
ncbi:tenascin-like isoform 1-T1 [Synchiropus picturatus]